MNKDEIENMQEGSELDAIIADKIMHINKRYLRLEMEADFDKGHYIPNIYWWKNDFDQRSLYDSLEHYSTDISAAWKLVEELEGGGVWFILSNVIPNSDPIVYEAKFYSFDETINVYACEYTVPLAICKAALLTLLDE
jgi:hypothetical protein